MPSNLDDNPKVSEEIEFYMCLKCGFVYSRNPEVKEEDGFYVCENCGYVCSRNFDDHYLFKDYNKTSCCDDPEIEEEDGFNVCVNCGCVFSRILDNSPRISDEEFPLEEEIHEKRSNERVYSQIGPRTTIRGSRDARGNLLSPKYKLKFNKLAKIHRSLTTTYDRNLWIALPKLQSLQKRLGIPDAVAEDTLRIYSQTVKKKLTMGRSIDSLLAASIFCALRVNGIPRTVEEIAKVAQIPQKKVTKSYRLIMVEILPNLNLKVQHFTADRYVDKFYDELRLSMKCRNLSQKVIEKANQQGFNSAGKDPKGIAAASIYICSKLCNETRTQKEISKLSRVTEVTLRMRVKELMKYVDIK